MHSFSRLFPTLYVIKKILIAKYIRASFLTQERGCFICGSQEEITHAGGKAFFKKLSRTN